MKHCHRCYRVCIYNISVWYRGVVFVNLPAAANLNFCTRTGVCVLSFKQTNLWVQSYVPPFNLLYAADQIITAVKV